MQDESKTVVLVADDEPSVLAMVSSHLRAKGYSVLEASDGDQAWELAHEHLPDLVVLDVMMPGMSGWEVCRKIREAVSLAHTGVLMLTGIGENLNEMTSPLYGADAHVDKPFEFADLDERIEETLERRRAGAVGRVENEGEEAVESEPAPARKKRGKGEAPHRPTLPAGAAQDEELDDEDEDEDELDTMDEELDDEDDEELDDEDEDEDDEELAADFESDDEAIKPPVKTRPKAPIAKSSGKKKAPALELSEPPKARQTASKAAAKSPSPAKAGQSDEGAKPLAEAATSVAGAMFKRAASALKNVPKSVVSALTPASSKAASSKSGSATKPGKAAAPAKAATKPVKKAAAPTKAAKPAKKAAAPAKAAKKATAPAKPAKKAAAPAKAAKPVKKAAAPAKAAKPAKKAAATKAPAKTGRTASKKAAKAAPPKAPPRTKAAKAPTKPAKTTAKSVAKPAKKSPVKLPKAPSKALQASTMTAANAVTDRGNRAKRAAHLAKKPKPSPAKGKAVPNRKPKR